MAREEFNAAETIAGFPLPSIKHALSQVGISDDRDDIQNVVDALECPPRQAQRILEALEQRGFVTKAAKKRQWEVTPVGNRLRFQWKPPRRIHPAIDCETEPSINNEVFEAVPCSILRSDGQGDAFEEADLAVGVFVEYQDDRLVEISVEQPDDYDHRDSDRTIECSVRLNVANAKRIAKALEAAIAAAEGEIAHRAKAKPLTKKRVEPDPEPESATHASAGSRKPEGPSAAEKVSRGASTTTSGLATARSLSQNTGPAKKARDEDRRKRKEQAALAATLKELRAKR